MITLDATLQTAQDGASHRPIAEIISSPMGDIVPTAGNYFNSLTTAEAEPHITLLSTGALAVIVERAGALKYLYTPTDRSEFTEVAVSIPYATNASDPCICELADGNIGIVFIVANDLYYKIISPTGAIVTDYTKLYETGSSWVANPYVIKLADDSYVLVYPEGTGTPPDTGNTYTLKQRTSSDFESWSAATDITPAAFAAERYCNNPHLLQVTSGRIFVMVDYLSNYVNETELNNIYYMTSDDNGSTWSAAIKVTDFTDLGSTATHPTMAEKENGDITFMYAEKSVVKMLDKDMTGYPENEIKDGGWISYVDGKIHWRHGIHSVGDPNTGLTTINANSWTWERTLTELSIPALIPEATTEIETDCEWFAGRTDSEILAINMTSETSKHYVWGFSAGGDVSYLVSMGCGYADNAIRSAVIATHNEIRKLFILHECSGYGSYAASLGWIDLDEVADPITGLYTYHEIWNPESSTGMNIVPGTLHSARLTFDYTHNYLFTNTWPHSYTAENPGVCVWNESGTIILKLISEEGGIPYNGIRSAVFIGDDIYFSFTYYSGEADKRGLGVYHAATATVSFIQPTWATVDDFMFNRLQDIGNGRILMVSNNTLANGGGVVIYDTTTGEWTVFNDDIYPGFGRTGALWRDVDYDPITQTIYAVYGWTLIAFSEYGPYSLLKYTDIENVDSTIDVGEYTTFSYNFFEYQANITYDPDGVLWAVWQHVQDGSEYSAKWANLLDDVEITDYITGSISITWDVERIAQLQFSIAKGHLYDPQNLMSTLSPFLRKGRKIAVRLGETVDGSDYLQEQGEFYITSVALEYSVDKYPTANVTAEDLRTLWEFNEVAATRYYEGQTPYNTMEHILLNYGDMSASELDIPETWENEHNLYHQFVDMTLEDIVQTLMDHFGYFPYVNVDGKFEPRYIDLTKATDHTYSDNTKIIKYTPDDKYSSFINRVIVKGISHVYFEVLYEEEAITSLSGTTGWWGKDVDEKVWFSDDHNRTCRYARMEILQSVTEFNIFGIKGGGDEQITEIDADEQYIVITIESPNLVGVFIATLATLIVVASVCKHCDRASMMGGGFCGWCIYICMTLLNIVLYILGAVASYSYNVWARPIGHEKRTFQAQADDEALINEMGGKKVRATIDDPMCYTISICQTVANHELAVIMAQRRRLKFEKTSHLQDEIGDVIEFVHPYSSETLKILAAKLKRNWEIGGDCTDEIESWRIV